MVTSCRAVTKYIHQILDVVSDRRHPYPPCVYSHRIGSPEMPFRPDSRSSLDSPHTSLRIGSEGNIAVLLRRRSRRAVLLRVDGSIGEGLDRRDLLLGLALRERDICKEAHVEFSCTGV